MSPRTTSHDVVVVGAGPAGAATALGALAAEPGLRVLLLDRADFPRDKSCGDGIAPHVVTALAEVGAADVVDGWRPLRRLELARAGSVVDGTMARPVHVIPRAVFDHRLLRRALDAGAELRRHRVAGVRPGGAGVDVAEGIRAPVVVGADGAHSVLRRQVLGDRRPNRALAIRGYAPTTDDLSGRQVIRYGERRQPSYAWSFDRGDGLCNVGYGELLDQSGAGAGPAPPSRRLLLAELDRLVPGAARTGQHWRAHHLPLSGWRWRAPDGPVLLAGDAAGLVNPMTGEGIYYAVATGILAGRVAATAVREGDAADAGRRHRAAVRELLGAHLRHTWIAARLSRSPAVVSSGIRAAAADQRSFDALVELGLGDGRITPRLAGRLLAALRTFSPPPTLRVRS